MEAWERPAFGALAPTLKWPENLWSSAATPPETLHEFRNVTRAMLAAGRSGAILNVGSVNSFLGLAYAPAYVASKHGLIGPGSQGSPEEIIRSIVFRAQMTRATSPALL
jgi:hypothetical protein